MYYNNNYNSGYPKNRTNLQNGEKLTKSFRVNKKGNGFYMSFQDNGKTYTVFCYDNIYTPSSGKYNGVQSKAGAVLVSKR